MGRETFLLLFVLGSAVLAFWVAFCRPSLAPTSFRSGTIHMVAALVVGSILGPVLHAVPGLPAELSVLAALFIVALPAITYMVLVGFWLVQLAAGQMASPGR
jgi:hypothetical protein